MRDDFQGSPPKFRHVAGIREDARARAPRVAWEQRRRTRGARRKMRALPNLPRRAALHVLAAAASVRWPVEWPEVAATELLLASAEPLLSPRLDATSLTPLLSTTRSMPGDLHYPSWLDGTWRVTTVARGFILPLGPRFVEPELVVEARKPVRLAYRARFIDAPPPAGSPSLSVRQDRRYNAMQEEGAFLSSGGFVVEQGSYMCDATTPHGKVVLDVLDTDVTGTLQEAFPAINSAVVVRSTFRFKQELDILWASWEDTGNAFTTSELTVQRQLLPGATRGGAAEEVGTNYLELLTRYERPSTERPTAVRARYRVVQYLGIPGVAGPATATRAARGLEKQAAGQAVSILDYDLLLERADEGEGGSGPRGT